MLHPKIESSLCPDARIADIATGTGVILTDLAMSLPATYQFDGFDISSAQFPSDKDLPKNVKLHIADAKAPLDSEYHDIFDVVNVRYLNVGMKPRDWEIVSRNIYDLLKPGGWIQWIEPDFYQASRWFQLDPKVKKSNTTQEIMNLIGSSTKEFEYFGFDMEGIFREVGLRNIVHEVTSTDRIPETRPIWAEITIGPMTLKAMANERSKESDGRPEHCAKLMETLHEEATAGIIYSRYDLHVILGQKP